ncbi:MAG: hypothetical protein R2799_02850 [Crocinitomicaceae bacterium]
MEKLVFAELIGGVSFQMLEDKKVVTVSEGAFFLVTTEEHSKEYPGLKFEDVSDDAFQQYGLKNYSERVWELLKPISLVQNSHHDQILVFIHNQYFCCHFHFQSI